MNTHPDDARPPALRQAAIGEQAWLAAAEEQLAARPNHSDFYALAGHLSPTLYTLMHLASTLRGQVSAYGDDRPIYDDTRAVDPHIRLSRAAEHLAQLRDALADAHRHTESYWSEISHIGVGVTP